MKENAMSVALRDLYILSFDCFVDVQSDAS